MTATQRAYLIALIGHLAMARPSERVSSWCEREVIFNEPDCRGPFSFAGREYLREPLDWYGSGDTDLVLCFGTRAGKTRIFFAGKAWLICNDPCRMFCVMPNTHGTGGAQNVSRTRFQPMIRSSPILAKLIPKGNRRHEFKALQQILGGSILDWTGSNSPANLAGLPARYVEQDEVDKYKRLGDREADPSKLADERCKEFSNPKRAKASTPTLYSGLIWQELLKTDIRRRFMPCPHCRKFVVFAWSRDFTVLPKTGCEAYIRWDKEAKRANGEWDLDRVRQSSRAECPFCHGHILDTHKTRMDRDGEWRPTKEGAPKMRGYHLPSMYASTPQTRFGEMALKFLKAKHSIQGLQGFINSDLAEPYQAQELMRERIEIISKRIQITGEWNKLLTVDCQARAPHFWYVARAWNGADSEGIEAGPCDTWEDLRTIQTANQVKDEGVIIDSGFGARSDAEVYRNCASYSEIITRAAGQLPLAMGWMPAKGMPGHKRWTDQSTGLVVPYYLRGIDPFVGTADAGKCEMSLFEFSSDFFKDVLEALRQKRHKCRWSVSEKMATEEYWRHMDGQIKIAKENKFDGRVRMIWMPRHTSWPDHLFDCEVQQVAGACFFGWLPLDEPIK